ncbi:MAG TPA: ScyD/ScyE family protein [Marmoricola sp.]|nr:ScyD/ScyE family protein [Marmoricola sp.]
MSAVAVATAAAVVAVPPALAAGGGSGVSVVAKGLDGPFGVQRAPRHKGFVVAEGDTGKVTRVFMNGRTRVLLRGATGVAGVAASPTRVFAVTGGGDETGPGGSGKYAPAKVVRMDYKGRHVKVIADLMKYELKHNPDGQVQFVNGEPVDALSNPFSMTWSRFGLFVADGGANDVLKVNPRTGHVSTFFVPPTVKDVRACKGPDANANPGTKGCDPVPTGVQVRGKSVYVSTLGAEAPRAGRIYKLNAHTGKVQRVWKGFTAPTGVAVRKDGTIYFSQVLKGAPAGDPGPDFDPSTVGQITRIKHGHVKRAQVTMPTGLALKGGHLFSSAWSVASFLGIPDAGQVVRVRDKAFH